jgi:hypothetical protein
MGKRRCASLVGKPGGGKDHLEDRSVDGRIKLKRVFKN